MGRKSTAVFCIWWAGKQLGKKINVLKIEEYPEMSIKSVHFKKPITRSSFLSKSVVIFVIVILKMTTLFERNEDRVTGFLK